METERAQVEHELLQKMTKSYDKPKEPADLVNERKKYEQH